MTVNQQAIEAHYSRMNLEAELLEALKTAGKDLEALTRDDLAPVDEFHIRGREATRELARLAAFEAGMRVLDVGCGIGGSARTLAAEVGCEVVGVDVVDSYCKTASSLSGRVGLGNEVAFIRADATELPFTPATFDAAILLHVTMNISEKAALFDEIARVLKSGGRLALYEICAGSGGDALLPVPWATDEVLNHLLPPESLRALVMDAGFTKSYWRDVSQLSLEWFKGRIQAADAPRASTSTARPLGPHLLMGDSAAQKMKNMVANLEQDRIRVIQGVFRLG